MTDADFLAAIIADPKNDVPRLIYADWLEERGDPRGEFIRRSCVPPYHCYRYQFPEGPPAALEILLGRPTGRGWVGVRSGLIVIAPPLEGIAYTISRGFVEAVRCTAKDWSRYAKFLVATQPIQDVEIAGVVSAEDRALFSWTPGFLITGFALCHAFAQQWPGIHFYTPGEGPTE